MYKEFGIYAGQEYTCIITDITPIRIIGFSVPNSQLKELKNETINIILNFEYLLVKEDDLFEINFIKYPDVFEQYQYGYLGQINDLSLQNEIREYINELIQETGWKTDLKLSAKLFKNIKGEVL